MSFRTDMLVVADEVTDILGPGPDGLDQIPHQVFVIQRTWAAGEPDGTTNFTDAVLALPKKLYVDQLTTRQVAESGSTYEIGDIRVSGIVPADPANPGVGFYPEQLAPPVLDRSVELFYRLTGPHRGDYRLIELQTDRTYEYRMVLRRLVTTPLVTSPQPP